MEPVKGNSLNRSCGEIISSNCVTWAGPAVPGVCGGNVSLTQVVQQTVLATAPATSCYTGNWVDFTTSIPASGSNGGGVSWSIGSFGVPFGGSGGITGIQNVPQYKWSKEGNLEVRGSFALNITPTFPVTNVFLQIPLVTIAGSCFSNITGALSQTHLVAVDAFGTPNTINTVSRGHLTINPLTGVLFFDFSYAQSQLSPFGVQIFMGGTTFNLS